MAVRSRDNKTRPDKASRSELSIESSVEDEGKYREPHELFSLRFSLRSSLLSRLLSRLRSDANSSAG